MMKLVSIFCGALQTSRPRSACSLLPKLRLALAHEEERARASVASMLGSYVAELVNELQFQCRGMWPEQYGCSCAH